MSTFAPELSRKAEHAVHARRTGFCPLTATGPVLRWEFGRLADGDLRICSMLGLAELSFSRCLDWIKNASGIWHQLLAA